jgi:acyl-CoA synthetase (AMP-forming)/AMP-acid ligase II/acyl carrier protein
MGLIGNVLQPIYAGFPTVLMSPVTFIQSPVRWLEAITRYRATVAGAPNFAYDLCVEKVTPAQLAALDLRSWRIAYNGSEPIRAATLQRFVEAFAPAGFRAERLLPCYGLAESTLVVTAGDPVARPIVQRVDRGAVGRAEVRAPEDASRTRDLVGCGQVMAGHRLCIVDPEELRVLSDREVGEIWIAGPSVAGGYWDSEEASHITFGARTADGDGPFLRSGDLGFLDRGELFVTGRIKELIIVRGRNYDPQDIEVIASQCSPAMRRNAAAAFGVEVDGEEQVVLVQEVERGARSTDWSEVFPRICEAVAEAHDLGLYAIALIRTNTLPKTSSGKIQRHAARARFVAGELDVVARWSRASAPERRSEGSDGADPERASARGAPGWTPPAARLAPGPAAPARAATAPPGHPLSYERLLEAVVRWAAAALKRHPESLDVDRPLAQYGMDSRAAIGLAGDLERELGVALSPALLYDHPTVSRLARYLCDQAVP